MAEHQVREHRVHEKALCIGKNDLILYKWLDDTEFVAIRSSLTPNHEAIAPKTDYAPDFFKCDRCAYGSVYKPIKIE